MGAQDRGGVGGGLVAGTGRSSLCGAIETSLRMLQIGRRGLLLPQEGRGDRVVGGQPMHEGAVRERGPAADADGRGGSGG